MGVIASGFTSQAAISSLRQVFTSGDPHAVLLPGAMLAEAREALRESAAGAPITVMAIADRGSYRQVSMPDSPFLEILAEYASAIAGETLVVRGAALRRLARGDYSLTKDDTHPLAGLRAELLVDLSSAATGEAEVTWTDGGSRTVALLQSPGSVALVERAPGIHRHERYLTARVGERVVERLYLSLAGS